MIVNVCASSISREPLIHTTLYSTYYYTEKRASTKSNKTVVNRKQSQKQPPATEALSPKVRQVSAFATSELFRPCPSKELAAMQSLFYSKLI
ncbi:hypothetical protein OESDEN_11754 [Oesophagostomum dentatum]|uniref:Uncharacterized protein n=1 Tax=Oesophagostomum dentatum TaxID=61180 RepID=A0A0B1SX05_OESDE|nr:hypothetical protein OESDEN_11754 [Oesophagostomum dentatum]